MERPGFRRAASASQAPGPGDAVSPLPDAQRRNIAFALHDGIVQSVTAALLELEGLRQRIERSPDDAIAALEESKREIRRSLAELREVIFALCGNREPTEAAATFTGRVQEALSRWKTPASVRIEGDLGDVSGRILSVAYAVIREAVANAAKHSAGRSVSVDLSRSDGEVSVTVDDEGPGFTSRDEASARAARHVGLDMMRRRVREVGGRLSIDSRPGEGTHVTARLPVREAAVA
jgi:signal transduction histidine kinase